MHLLVENHAWQTFFLSKTGIDLDYNGAKFNR